MATATIALLLIQLSGFDDCAYTEKLREAWLPHRCQGDSYAIDALAATARNQRLPTLPALSNSFAACIIRTSLAVSFALALARNEKLQFSQSH